MRPRQSSLGILNRVPLCGSTRDGCCFNEAEAIKPRNLTAAASVPLTECSDRLASMRPRQSSLGIVKHKDYNCRCSHRSAGFNEAEAIKPRNRRSTPLHSWTRSAEGFNEAEAIKPRNQYR